MRNWQTRLPLIFAAATVVATAIGCGSGEDGLYVIRGSARLPDCTTPPALTLSPNWFDEGTVEVLSAGCAEASPGDRFPVCALNWTISQQGGEIEITVDDEYRIKGRLCGNELHLEGGWWLPVQNELGGCSYDDDDGSEVLIQDGGSTLTINQESVGGQNQTTLSGNLSLAGNCTGRYEITLREGGG